MENLEKDPSYGLKHVCYFEIKELNTKYVILSLKFIGTNK